MTPSEHELYPAPTREVHPADGGDLARSHFPRLPSVPAGGRQLVLFSKNVSEFEDALLKSDRTGPELGEFDSILTYGQVDPEEELEDDAVLEGDYFEGM